GGGVGGGGGGGNQWRGGRDGGGRAARRGGAGPRPQQVRARVREPVAGPRGIEQVGADRGVVEGRRRAAGHPPLDERLDVVADETPAAEVGRGLLQSEDGGTRRGMMDAEQGQGRLRG